MREEGALAEMTREQAVKKVAELIEDIEIAMLTTVDADGSLRGRPMMTQEAEFDGELWFFTADPSPKTGEVRRDRQVNLSYMRPDKQRYVSVSGRAEVVRDRAKMEQLWRPALKAWFPNGLEDPELALLRVAVEHAEYWDSPSGKVVQLMGLASALVKGERAEVGEHGSIEIQRGGRSGGEW
jgi:general stress protein 26